LMNKEKNGNKRSVSEKSLARVWCGNDFGTM
jgi:hypothetical protein